MIRKLLALALLLIAPAAAHAEWHEASTEHFLVYSDGSEENIRGVAERLERFDKAVRFYLGWPNDAMGPANRVTVYVLDSLGDIERLIGRRGVGGFYQPRAGGSVAFVPEHGNVAGADIPQLILQHEYIHHLMLSRSPRIAYPGWFVEGFAEFYATAKTDGEGNVSFGLPPQQRAYGLMSGNWLPMDKMIVADSLKLTPAQREGLYGRGWLLTHYLHFNEARHGQFANYVLALNAGKSPKEAASVFGDLKALDKELEQYKRTRLQGRQLAARAIQMGAVTVRKLTPGEAATMAVRIRSKRGVNRETAPPVYEAAKKAAAPYPHDSGAQIVLAEAAYDAGDYAAAEAAADRAIAANAGAVDAHVYKAMARMGAARRAGDLTPATWAGIRKIIGTANRLDTEDPEPLILFYRSFVQSGRAPTENAKAGLSKAFQLAPQDVGLRMNVAAMHLQDGDAEAARTLLQWLAANPHSHRLAVVAARLIEMIDKKDLEGARKALTVQRERSEAGDDEEEGEDEDPKAGEAKDPADTKPAGE